MSESTTPMELSEASGVSVQAIGNNIYVQSPFKAALVAQIRILGGGRWMKEWKAWRWPLRMWPDVLDLYTSYYGSLKLSASVKMSALFELPVYADLVGTAKVFPDNHTMIIMGRTVAEVIDGKVVLGAGCQIERGSLAVGSNGELVLRDSPVSVSLGDLPMPEVLDHVAELAGMTTGDLPIKVYGGENPGMVDAGSSVAGAAPTAPKSAAAAVNLSPDDAMRRDELVKLASGFTTRRVASGLPVSLIHAMMAKYGIGFL